jgi:uncharacterized repeat protein (TIGR03806 family)
MNGPSVVVFALSIAGAACSGAIDAPAPRRPMTGADAAADVPNPPLPMDDGSADSKTNDADGRAADGPFGLSARVAPQTCIAPANFRQPATTLSATGCVDASDPKKPAPGLIPYDVNSPLWSDGADKRRFLALPDGATIHAEGHWQLPVGTVLVKSFLFAGKLIETRLFVRFADRWAGYSYQWNDAETDATIVATDGDTKTIVNGAGQPQDWWFPSRGGCLECHNDAVGGALGLETMQLDRKFMYPSGVVAEQIATLEHIGVFDAPIVRGMPLLDPRAPDPSGQMLDLRARSYLHANCSNCHRPGAPFNGLDLRVDVPFADMRLCNADPQKGDQGVPGAKLLVPRMPLQSVLYLRMLAADKAAGRMPTLASSVLDTQGLALISDWIQATPACP